MKQSNMGKERAALYIFTRWPFISRDALGARKLAAKLTAKYRVS